MVYFRKSHGEQSRYFSISISYKQLATRRPILLQENYHALNLKL